MADFDRVPVVEVHKDNLEQVWPTLVESVKTATYIAIDTELSGLGNRKLLNAKDLDDRYHHMCEIARTRSIVSLGMSCFKLLPTSKMSPQEENTSSLTKTTPSQLHFSVQTYNIVTLCEDQYVVEPISLKFLVEHGFDFNKQYSSGLPYKRGNDKDEDITGPCLRQLFVEVVRSKAPIVFHNAVVDLVFLYHNFYASLPTSQQAFLSDLAEMFPTGIFDTKYIADFKARMGASYLEFVFRKCQRDNIISTKTSGSCINVSFEDQKDLADCIVCQACGLPEGLSSGEHLQMDALCMQYANHGWCPNGNDCPKSHDIDLILQTQEHAPAYKRPKKRRKDKNTKDTEETEVTKEQSPETEKVDIPPKQNGDAEHSVSGASDGVPQNSSAESRLISNAGSHRAGFDAFMTGFIFGFFSTRYEKRSESSKEETDLHGAELGMEEYANKVYLVGKDIPLQIMKSSFSKTSKEHKAKMKKIGLAA